VCRSRYVLTEAIGDNAYAHASIVAWAPPIRDLFHSCPAHLVQGTNSDGMTSTGCPSSGGDKRERSTAAKTREIQPQRAGLADKRRDGTQPLRWNIQLIAPLGG